MKADSGGSLNWNKGNDVNNLWRHRKQTQLAAKDFEVWQMKGSRQFDGAMARHNGKVDELGLTNKDVVTTIDLAE